jgi:hypothetical protein
MSFDISNYRVENNIYDFTDLCLSIPETSSAYIYLHNRVFRKVGGCLISDFYTIDGVECFHLLDGVSAVILKCAKTFDEISTIPFTHTYAESSYFHSLFPDNPYSLKESIDKNLYFYSWTWSPYSLDNNHYIQRLSDGSPHFFLPTHSLYLNKLSGICGGHYGMNPLVLFESKDLYIREDERFFGFFCRSIPYISSYYSFFYYFDSNPISDCCSDKLDFSPIVKLLGGK